MFIKPWLMIDSLFNNAHYSDVTIRFGTSGIQIPAHRVILAAYSPLLNDVLSKTPETDLEMLLNDCSAHSYWRVFQYMYEQRYSDEAAGILGETGRWPISRGAQILIAHLDDEPELLIHASVALLARDLFYIPGLEKYALQRLKSQLHRWSASELFDAIQEIYATQNKAARQVFVSEATRSYSQIPQLAQALQKAAREIGDFEVELVEALGQMNRE